MASDNDNHDPWREGKKGILRGLIWTAAILLVAGLFYVANGGALPFG